MKTIVLDAAKIRENPSEEWSSLTAMKGESAYEIAVRRGYQGTEQQWLNALETERAAAVSSIQTAKENALNDIPQSYQELSDSVDDFKDNLVLIQTSQPNADDNRLWIDSDDTSEVTVPTYAEFSQLSEDIGLIFTSRIITDSIRADKWVIRDNGTLGFSANATGAYIFCKPNTKYRLYNAEPTNCGIGCMNTDLVLDRSFQVFGKNAQTIEIITTSDAVRVFYYTLGSFSDLTLYELTTTDPIARAEIENIQSEIEPLDGLESTTGVPKVFSFDASGTHIVDYQLSVGKTYYIQNTLDSLSDVTVTAYNNSTSVETIANPLSRGSIVKYSPSSAANKIRFYSSSSGAKISVINAGTIYDKVYSVHTPNPIFKYNTELKDISAENDKMDWSEPGTYTVLEQVYALFDALVTNHSAYVTRVDAASELDMSYPEYANGISEAGTYMVTPAYKTYMYKLIDTNAYAGNGADGNCKKKKILIIGAEHGNEICSAFNCYLLANELCKCTDPDIFRLRSAYDIYILPCLNGYGMYHRIRGNGNLVDINRNYPVIRWAKAGENTKTDEVDALNQYTGPSAGSEFETQLVMGLINSIKPDIFIDHHNYGNEQNWQFYTETVNPELANPLYNSLVDCSVEFKDKYPQYFGANYSLLVDSSGGAPGTIPPIGAVGGTSYRWAYQNGFPVSLVCEISRTINYIGGSHATQEQDKYGDDTFSIALYTLENVIKRMCDYQNKM